VLKFGVAHTVAFQWKDYRVKSGDRRSVMHLSTAELIRRFLIHVLPDRFHRIRHYGLLASSKRKANIAKVRTLLGAQPPQQDDPPATEVTPLTRQEPCPTVAVQCASSRPSDAARNRKPAHHLERPPHDEMHANIFQPFPDLQSVQGRYPFV
jgi:hypothetical protein